MKTEKRCPRCGETKSASEFYTLGNRVTHRLVDGEKTYKYPRLSSTCRPCAARVAREWQLRNPERYRRSRKKYEATYPERVKESARRTGRKTRYGVTPEQYDQMLIDQDGLCAICREQPAERPLAVDHNHRSGFVRGLLCRQCNHGIGNFRDDPDLLMAAIDYLVLRSDEDRLKAIS